MRFMTSRRIRFLALACVSLLASCRAPFNLGETVVGSGHVLVEPRAVKSFDRIALHGAMTLEVQVGPEPSLTIAADDNLLEFLRTEVSSGELRLEVEGSLSSRNPFVAKVTVPSLKRLRVAGRAQLSASGVASDKLQLEVSGSCTGSIEGTVDTLEVEVAGSGRLDLATLEARRVSLTITGSLTAELCASERLMIDHSGSASVSYWGDPVLEVDETGTLHLTRRGASGQAGR
jgi:hypothetical protein